MASINSRGPRPPRPANDDGRLIGVGNPNVKLPEAAVTMIHTLMEVPPTQRRPSAAWVARQVSRHFRVEVTRQQVWRIAQGLQRSQLPTRWR